MAQFNYLSWKASLPVIDKNDPKALQKTLEYWAQLNTNSSTLPMVFNSGNNIQVNARIQMFKSAYSSRFRYSESDEIDTYLLEEVLWYHGQVAIIKDLGKLQVGYFQIVKPDSNNNPKIIRFVPIAHSGDEKPKTYNKGQQFRVGESAVIIRDDRPSLINNGYIRAPFLTVSALVEPLVHINNYKYHNLVVNRPIIPLSPLTKKEVLTSMNSAINGNSSFIALGNTPDPLYTGDMKPFDFKDRTNEILDTYNHEENAILGILGFDSNAFPHKKERQITAEIKSNNTVSRAVLQSKLDMRQKGLKELKKVFKVDITVDIERAEAEEVENAPETQSQVENKGKPESNQNTNS